jgi:hypothetical protein
MEVMMRLKYIDISVLRGVVRVRLNPGTKKTVVLDLPTPLGRYLAGHFVRNCFLETIALNELHEQQAIEDAYQLDAEDNPVLDV